MYLPLFVAVFVIGLLLNFANASGESTEPFVDGRWNGGIGTVPGIKGLEECWASTKFNDGTVLTLAKRNDGSWHLRLSNPGWQLLSLRRYATVAQVDFYPRLYFTAEAQSATLLEIANLEQIHLLGPIENGHTIDLTSKGFHVKYDLEGSAKAIERVRNCLPG
jgi:hypothetical protein